MTGTLLSKPPRPWVAGLLSLLAPGAGQLYAGRARRAIIAFAVGIVVTLPAAYALLLIHRTAGMALVFFFSVGYNVLAALDALDLATRWPAGAPRQWWSQWYVITPFVVAGVYGSIQLTHLRRATLVADFNIPSSSMAPTILRGDRIVADMRPSARVPHRGALMVYAMIEDTLTMVLKRVLGLPGDTLAMRQGVLRVDGAVVPEPYLAPPGTADSLDAAGMRALRAWVGPHLAHTPDSAFAPTLDSWGPVIVPHDSVFVLGDNRDDSYDSRYFGFLPVRLLRGTARYIMGSKDSLGH